MLSKVLEYQSVEAKLIALQKELVSNTAKQTLEKMKASAREAQNKLIELENQAQTIIQQYSKTKEDFDKVCDQLNKLIKVDTESLSEEQLRQNIEQSSALSITLGNLERSLSYQKDVVSSILKNFEICKKNIVVSRQKYKECKEKFDAFESEINPKIDSLKKEMSALEKDIDATLLSKYKHLRQDRIFPVFVPLRGDSCGGCSMGLPAALMTKLKQNGYLECEQCRRFIYIL